MTVTIACPTVKRRRSQIKGIVRDARALGCTRQHLWAVLRQRRRNPGLVARYKELHET